MNIGELVGGRFRIEALAGAGGMGSVYRATDLEAGAPVALKVLYPGRIAHVVRFTREAVLLRELRHPGIVAYIAEGVLPTGAPYIAMEWVPGRTLAELIELGPLGTARSLRIARAAAEALAKAHAQGVVHRDIKPRNIMVGDDGTVKVLDFGIARAQGDSSKILTQTGVFLGTPGYIAPEQARGERNIDGRADVFSLGCVLFECLTGRPAFFAKEAVAMLAKLVVEVVPPPSELVTDIPPALDLLLGRMLAKDPTQRVSSGQEVAAELSRILGTLAPGDGAGNLEPTLTRRRLTEGELELFSVVLSMGQGETTVEEEGTVAERPRGSSLTDELARLGTRPERLADGSVLCTITGAEVATDLAGRAARCALTVARLHPGRPVVICTGRGVLAGIQPVGEVIDRAAALLRAAASDAPKVWRPTPGVASPGPGPEASKPEARRERSDRSRVGPALPGPGPEAWIPIDALTAGLLDAGFEVQGRGGELFLVRERQPLEVRRRLLGRDAPFFGRDRDLQFLLSLFEECREEPAATAVVVLGQPGMGKSRLLSELLDRAAAERVALWVAKNDALAAQSPFSLVAQLVRRAAGIHDDEPKDVQWTKLGARLLRHFPPARAEDVAGFLGELAAVRAPGAEGSRLRAARHDPMLMREEIERAWTDFVSAECAHGPLVVLLEDLQWGDLPSVKLVERAFRANRDAPLFVLAAGRPGVEVLFPSLWEAAGVHELRLAKLSRSASRNLVKSVLGERVSEERVEAMVARADGNAFYLEELIRAVAETESHELPDTLVAMVSERLHALDGEARRVLRAASVFGESFWSGGVRAALGDGRRDETVERWLEVLRSEEIVEVQPRSRFRGEVQLGFRHALLREAAYASLVPEDREIAHRSAAIWLEQAGESDAARLAEHFERGGERGRAALLYRRAAEQALEGHDLAVAMSAAERGIGCGAAGEELGRLRIVQGEVHALRGENLEAERSGTEVLQLVPRGAPAWSWAAGATVGLRIQLGEADGAEELAGALCEVDATDPQAAAALVRAAASAIPYLLFGGFYGLARRLLARAQESVEHLEGAAEASRGWVRLAEAEVLAWAEGDHYAALRAATAAAERFAAAGSELGGAISATSRAAALVGLGREDEARSILDGAIGAADRLGAGFHAALARLVAGRAVARRDAGAGKQLLEAAVESFYRQGNTIYFGMARTALARVLFSSGDVEGARREAEEAAFAFGAASALRVTSLAVLGRAQLALGERAEALATLEEAHEAFTRLGAVADNELLLCLGYARTLEAAGRTGEAEAVRDAARTRMRARAARIEEPELRESFLALPEHLQLLELEAADTIRG